MDKIETRNVLGGQELWSGTMSGPDKKGQPTQHHATRWKGGYRCVNSVLKPEDEGIEWRRRVD